jgi:hypothetical protein
VGEPYREKGERPPLPAELRRWYNLEKGPFDEDILRRSLKSGKLKSTTLVRAEDETTWRPIGDVAALLPKAPAAFRSELDPRRDLVSPDVGSFGLGFAAGLFGGCIGALVVMGVAKGSSTKQGALVGAIVQLFVVTVLRILARQEQ